MFIGELVLQAVLAQAKKESVTDPRLIPAMFGSLPETVQASALQFFRERGEEISIVSAFPRNVPTTPLIAVLPGAMSETDQLIGNVGAIGQDPENRFESREGMYFSAGYRCLVLSQNADVVTWVASFVLFTMVRYRNYFTDLGLIKQSVQMSDFNVAEEFQPEFVFTRAVTLSGEHFVDFPVTLAAPPPALAVVATIPSLPETVTVARVVTDNFTRPDVMVLNNAVTGHPWAVLAGTWGILSNRAYLAASGGADRDAAVIESGVPDTNVQATFSVVATGQRLVFRASDADNYFALEVAANYRLRRRQAGVYSTLATFGATTPQAGDIVRVALSAFHIRFYLNGTFVGEVSDTFNQTATKHGLGIGTGATAGRFADFRIS